VDAHQAQHVPAHHDRAAWMVPQVRETIHNLLNGLLNHTGSLPDDGQDFFDQHIAMSGHCTLESDETNCPLTKNCQVISQ